MLFIILHKTPWGGGGQLMNKLLSIKILHEAKNFPALKQEHMNIKSHSRINPNREIVLFKFFSDDNIVSYTSRSRLSTSAGNIILKARQPCLSLSRFHVSCQVIHGLSGRARSPIKRSCARNYIQNSNNKSV